MAIEKGYRQIQVNSDGAFEFEVRGAGVIVFTAVVGTWQLDFIAPDGEAIPLIDEIDSAFQQVFANTPEGTKLKLSGGTSANCWVGQAFNTPEGLLL